ncbi:hypothetical protein BDA99DRAFT_237969 [Phascolomyces articulosus]|uniref:RRM domain-containing protein n=1 Tax=Phascolomyces articulosus TaxID=60185 RepID=A0AAD5KKN8_9FUNG|nr:hypothetical protein BDA99DRAFT_237969 [Phascolomyces articulosus]
MLIINLLYVKDEKEEAGVIYLGRIPHGFYEDEMKGYFSQFGTVSQLRLARNKRGHPKHYGFIEFESSQVAEIVAETMDNYLLLGHLLQCKVLPKESIHPNLFKGAAKRFRKANTSIIQQKKHNQKRSEEKQHQRIVDLVKTENERRKKIKELGIDYDFPGYAAEFEKYKKTKANEPKKTETKDDKKPTKVTTAATKRKRTQKAEAPKKEEAESAKPAAKKAKRVTKPRAAKK